MTMIAQIDQGSATRPARPTIAIIGGGFTGATLAFHLARNAVDAQILVIEPRAQLGAGLAYSTQDPSHRINVPASRMTIDTSQRGDFQQWIEDTGTPLSPGTQAADGALYPQRAVFGAYVADRLRPWLLSGRITHIQARAIAVVPGTNYAIRLDNGRVIRADHLVIATSHPAPGVPTSFAALTHDARVVTDPSDTGPITAIARTARNVLIVGTGLTSADVIASLERQGFAGRITAMSRRGLRSRGHASDYPESEADFASQPETTALAVLRRIRAAVRTDRARGLPWQAALDNVRRDGPAIWAALPQAERARLVNRLRVWWDVHRFRIAPQVQAVLDDLIARSRLTLSAGHLHSATATPAGIAVNWTPRRATPRRDLFDAVVLTTGPAHGGIIASNPVIASLADAGLVRPDALHLGLEVTDGCRAVGTNGQPSPNLSIAGPLARGHVGELMGIPEVTAHAETVAAALSAQLTTI
ncbi:MAG: FAD/NAD(P)-binding protein [Paracoccus sp. (in: a-proteobacteria)]|uniref:FAD/NAD(P)-binding protein n=1 Tax=Paracoccus sp. TaxID=267 RepID=UPI0026E0000F|nr:FAD/NAD(P)-binding protein [Paracoccus sp. (in: a-proteobacteria)]MDO5632739.1 FAD/NAD(P)-binding protein [Paracoccus sp. (in: a-proteobacteria)]